MRDVATMMDTIARNGLRDSLQRRETHDGRPILSRDSIQRLDGLDGRLVISPGGRIPPSIGIQSSPLSLVGYNHNDLLYSSIRANHVQVTGPTDLTFCLCNSPSFLLVHVQLMYRPSYSLRIWVKRVYSPKSHTLRITVDPWFI